MRSLKFLLPTVLFLCAMASQAEETPHGSAIISGLGCLIGWTLIVAEMPLTPTRKIIKSRLRIPD